MFFHVFAQTTHVVAAPHGFACVGIPATQLYIPSFIKIRSGVSEPQGVKIWPFPLLWLVAFTTACTTVQAVTSRDVTCGIGCFPLFSVVLYFFRSGSERVKWSPVSYRSSAGHGKFAGRRPTFYHCGTQPTNIHVKFTSKYIICRLFSHEDSQNRI